MKFTVLRVVIQGISLLNPVRSMRMENHNLCTGTQTELEQPQPKCISFHCCAGTVNKREEICLTWKRQQQAEKDERHAAQLLIIIVQANTTTCIRRWRC